jgi:hypothetical protein
MDPDPGETYGSGSATLAPSDGKKEKKHTLLNMEATCTSRSEGIAMPLKKKKFFVAKCLEQNIVSLKLFKGKFLAKKLKKM